MRNPDNSLQMVDWGIIPEPSESQLPPDPNFSIVRRLFRDCSIKSNQSVRWQFLIATLWNMLLWPRPIFLSCVLNHQYGYRGDNL